MTKVVSNGYQCYNGRWLHAGDEFETDTYQEAEDMVVLNRASWPKAGAAEPEAAAAAAPNGARRRARRKDMRVGR